MRWQEFLIGIRLAMNGLIVAITYWMSGTPYYPRLRGKGVLFTSSGAALAMATRLAARGEDRLW